MSFRVTCTPSVSLTHYFSLPHYSHAPHRHTHTLSLSLAYTHTHTRRHTHTYKHTLIHGKLQTHTHNIYIYLLSSQYVVSKRISIIFSFPLYSVSNCSITEEGFSSLASALRSNPSHIKDLWLNRNKAGDSGVKHLSSLLED